MAIDEPQATSPPAIMLDPDALAAADPSVCVRTGRVASHRRHEHIYNIPGWLYTVQRTIGIPISAVFIRSAVVPLPISEGLCRKLRRFEAAATTVAILAVFGLTLAAVLRSPVILVVALGAITVPLAVIAWKRRNWVRVTPLRNAMVGIEGCDPRFIDELPTSRRRRCDDQSGVGAGRVNTLPNRSRPAEPRLAPAVLQRAGATR